MCSVLHTKTHLYIYIYVFLAFFCCCCLNIDTLTYITVTLKLFTINQCTIQKHTSPYIAHTFVASHVIAFFHSSEKKIIFVSFRVFSVSQKNAERKLNKNEKKFTWNNKNSIELNDCEVKRITDEPINATKRNNETDNANLPKHIGN